MTAAPASVGSGQAVGTAATTGRAVGRGLAALAAGLLFGLGLAVSQMTDPAKVLNFLDVAAAWDASLLFVMAGAVGVTVVGFPWVLRRGAPRFDDRFHLPARRAVDGALVAGAALFGVGWGLAGYCPGPALASVGLGNGEAWILLPAMAAGYGLRRWQVRRRERPAPGG